jgi:uncharacterized protein YbjT (DUF2867 family)
MSRTALVAGPTGLVGRLLVKRLLKNAQYSRVVVLTRRASGPHDPKLVEVLTDYDNLKKLKAEIAVDDVFCCLGTTMRKAGSRAAFERVDYHMVVDVARATKAAGAKQFLMVSAVGASMKSPAFYSRVKAQTEKAVSDLGFEAVHIMRPSLLLGPREERRIAEDIAQRLAPLVAPLFVGPLKKYRPVEADQVAAAMERMALGAHKGAHIHHLPLGS